MAESTTSTTIPGPHSGTGLPGQCHLTLPPEGDSVPSLSLSLCRPGYESVQASHRSRDLPLNTTLPSSTSHVRTQSPGGSVRAGEGGASGVRSSASLPRESSTRGSPTQEQLTASSSAPNQSSSQSNGGSGTPTIVVTRNQLQRRRPSTRQQLYMSRNTLHHELQLPDGYGEWENR